MTAIQNSEFGSDYTAYQVNRSWIRRKLRTIFLNRAASLCEGRALDFGCGIGELLRMLGKGSVGLEVNPHTVEYCRNAGLPVTLYEPEKDAYTLDCVAAGQFDTLIVSHVLEHLDRPDLILRTLFASARRIGVRRVVVIVPGPAGYASDRTHKTFIDRSYLDARVMAGLDGIHLAKLQYFPFPHKIFGELFKYNEMIAVFNLRPDDVR